MNLLALDVASRTGFATKSASGTWDFRPKRDESPGMRLIRFKAKIREMVEMEKIDHIVFEMVAGFHRGALIVAAELIGVLKTFCEENNIPYRSFTATEIKKFATGKGNASKDFMISEARLKLGYKGNDDNEADALWIYQLAMKELT